MMGDDNRGCARSGDDMPDVLRDALLQEAIARLHADGTLDEQLPPALRAAALAAFEQEHLDALLPDALALEAAPESADGLRPDLRDAALAAFDQGALETLLPDALAVDASEDEVAEAPAPALRAAALEAWDDATEPAPVLAFPGSPRARRTEPLRARRMTVPFLLRPYAAAALLLLALGAGLFLFGGDEEAEAGLQLRALSRRDMASSMGMSQVQPGYFASMGRLFTPARDELLSFSLAYDGLVVVGEGDALRVARPGTRVPGVAATDAVLRLESGEARLATREAHIPLEIDGVGLLLLEEGAAHVALHAETQDGAPAVALAERSVARFYRADGTSVALAGPKRFLLTQDGIRNSGAPARSLFRELAFFGGPLPQATQVRNVSARLFEARAGAVLRGRQDLRLLASKQAGAASVVTLAWRPPPALADARRLRVGVRAPAGTTIALAQTVGAMPRAEVAQDQSGSEPGTSGVELVLAEGWYDRLPEGRLELTVTVPAGAAAGDEKTTTVRRRRPTRAWFDGIALVLGAADDRAVPRAKDEG